MIYIISLIFIITSLGVGATALHMGKKSGSHATDESIAILREEARELENTLVQTLADAKNYTSAKQLAFLSESIDNLATNTATIKEQYLGLQQKISEAHKAVLTREEEHQELRSVTQEDRALVTTALSRFNEASSECMSLESRLADSLQTLDAMYSEISMTEPQKAMFENLSNALTSASGQLRNVIVDYESAHERLSTLQSRFVELEDEYSSLVEKQLLG
jgi:chromosome segregation ATPase